ncbi:hypothetical protein SETIT_2G171900v2 [Setaria italica]|uniref:Uncharacterized protein n=1 Tax=Setaria italica TaxID=4555 RepID=A0A368PZP7_SETIT|nr:hypothetical protein SETIT_2G171900v2 [Setaria italica]
MSPLMCNPGSTTGYIVNTMNLEIVKWTYRIGTGPWAEGGRRGGCILHSRTE